MAHDCNCFINLIFNLCKNTYVIIYWSAIIKQIGYLIDFTEDF